MVKHIFQFVQARGFDVIGRGVDKDYEELARMFGVDTIETTFAYLGKRIRAGGGEFDHEMVMAEYEVLKRIIAEEAGDTPLDDPFAQYPMPMDQDHEDQVGEDQVHVDQVHVDQVHEDQVQEDQVHEDQVQEDQVHKDQVQEDQVHKDQVQEDQVHKDQVHVDGNVPFTPPSGIELAEVDVGGVTYYWDDDGSVGLAGRLYDKDIFDTTGKLLKVGSYTDDSGADEDDVVVVAAEFQVVSGSCSQCKRRGGTFATFKNGTARKTCVNCTKKRARRRARKHGVGGCIQCKKTDGPFSMFKKGDRRKLTCDGCCEENRSTRKKDPLVVVGSA
jgi:hypothetical protein